LKILITQQEVQLPFVPYYYDALERSWHKFFQGHDLRVLPNDPKQDFDSIDYDCLVLAPGPDSVNRHFTENNVFEHARLKHKIIIGVCHGAFAINDICGGINLRKPGHAETDHVIYMEDNSHMVNSFHSQYIHTLAPGFESLAQDIDGHSEAFKHIFNPIYGILWHPERQKILVLPKVIADLLNN
jgi:anthranilate/para-aminobenzoate synthase component II